MTMTLSLPNLLAQGSSGGFWMPEQASTIAPDVDWLFFFILWVNIIFTVLIGVLLVYFAIKYRHTGEEKPAPAHAGHSTTLEITWTVIPTIIVLVIFYYGFRGYLDMTEEPANAYEIQVEAFAWGWRFTYPNGATDADLHLPKDVPVRLVMSSVDVIHSLYIPAMRVKKDAVPGRFNKFWVQAVNEGEFDLFCTEYCGTNHSRMIAKVVVRDTTAFQNHLNELADWTGRQTPVEAGQAIARKNGCFTCHSIDGSAGTGPTWLNLYGSQRQFTDGTSAVADMEYIRESIEYPARHIVAGYPNVMQSYLGRINERDLLAIIAYMRSISQNYQGDPNLYEGSPVGRGGAAPADAPADPTPAPAPAN
jgi:cytochrome c oxidase subunit 2